ncbi:hypothetical protein McpCs1_12630 [Methanocorpusculaceae archaeon Cs1]|uniref:Uncharacterized protein n=1 Tax=Methanorbis rubei TaxID=3028300 RepID=A0AAE4MGX4_9EURY|nr:hypothetical protein [Methanocorpusculaceae archaeon Cs1]
MHRNITELHGKIKSHKCTENACGAGMHGKSWMFFQTVMPILLAFLCIPVPQAFSVHSVKLRDISV